MNSSIVIVGAGPAGLSCARYLVDFGFKVTVFDAGEPIAKRDRHVEEQAAMGQGGAGLFSDGKFSFFPSASALRPLINEELYQEFVAVMKPYCDFDIPNLEGRECLDHLPSEGSEFLQKEYPSFYMDLDQRMKLIEDLSKDVTFVWNSEVSDMTRNDSVYDIVLKDGTTVTCDFVVVATGRFGPWTLRSEPSTFMRQEFGVRVVMDKSQWVHSSIDPKFIWKPSSDVEYRTFCTCVDGEVIGTDVLGIRTTSGHSDCEPTGKVNFGFHVRIKNPDMAISLGRHDLFECSVDDVDTLTKVFGEAGADLLTAGLTKLFAQFDIDADTVTLKGPCIEGVGDYPITTDELELQSQPNIFVAGDCTGKFRGIVAAMLSGMLVARTITDRCLPPIVGKNDMEALHEIHIFLAGNDVDKAMADTDEYNRMFNVKDKMKMCYLSLVFRDVGPVAVLQSARYIRSNDRRYVVSQAMKDAKFFASRGWTVARVKVEANAHFNVGMDHTRNYFEFHIKVEHKDGSAGVITDDESQQLLEVSKAMSEKFGVPVPLSWNVLGNDGNVDNPGYQRFLNMRFRCTSLEECMCRLRMLASIINETTKFEVVKTIYEYVWFDTDSGMDIGWID